MLTGILDAFLGYLIDILMFILWCGDDVPLLQIHLKQRMISGNERSSWAGPWSSLQTNTSTFSEG